MPTGKAVDLPKRFPLALSPENRGQDTTKDAKLINAFVERDQLTGEYQLFKRPGLLRYTQPSGGAATGRGVYNWLGDIYSIFDGTFYKGTTSKGAVDTTNGIYLFSSSSGATPRLVFGNGVKAYTYEDGGGLVQITDGDFPATFYKGWSYLDKTTYIMHSPNAIQGSDLDDPTSWDPLNLIYAQIRPDRGVGLAQQLVYTIAFKETSTEIFYDAQNGTGSPLGTVQGAKISYGNGAMETVQDIDGVLFWVATNQNASPQVMAMSQLNPQVISTPAVDRLLDEVDFTSCASWTFKESGHWFYGVTFFTDNITLVYDIREKMWAQWQDTNGNYFPIVSATKGPGQNHLFQHKSNGRIYYADASYYSDDTDLFTVVATTPNFDAGTKRGKQLGAIYFVTDQVPGSQMQVRKTDDDFQTWSNFRMVDLSKRLPRLTNCGTFSRRAYNLRHRANTPFRIAAMDLQMDLCTL